MSEITWSNETRKLSELTPWANNPRRIAPAEAERLEESLIEFGQVHPICIEPDGQICDGHQRQAVWQMSERFGPDYVVDVRVASRKLSERERQKLTVYLHRGTTGEFDLDELAGWDLDDLFSWGFEEHEFALDDGPGGEPFRLSDGEMKNFFEEVNQEQMERDDIKRLILVYENEMYEQVTGALLEHGDTHEDALCSLLGL